MKYVCHTVCSNRIKDEQVCDIDSCFVIFSGIDNALLASILEEFACDVSNSKDCFDLFFLFLYNKYTNTVFLHNIHSQNYVDIYISRQNIEQLKGDIITIIIIISFDVCVYILSNRISPRDLRLETVVMLDFIQQLKDPLKKILIIIIIIILLSHIGLLFCPMVSS